MRRPLLALALVLANALGAYGACPKTAPGPLWIETFPSCHEGSACRNGAVLFELQSSESPQHHYQIQPCDVVTWSFGDGTTETLTGSGRVFHPYPIPGNYAVEATISNALGSRTLAYRNGTVVVATSPSRLTFVTTAFPVEFLNSEPHVCAKCVELREGTSTTVIVERSLDLSRTVTAEAVMTIGKEDVRVPLHFGPGETQKTFILSAPDDPWYSGIQYSLLTFENVTGGTLTRTSESWQPALVLVDNDPPPTMWIEDSVVIAEGESEWTPIFIPVHLTAPMGVNTDAVASFNEGTATWDDFVSGGGPAIRAGETFGLIPAWIHGNTHPEPDKTFTVRLEPARTTRDPLVGDNIATVTIVNDDAELLPAQATVPAGSPLRMTLDLGSPYAVPTTITFASSNPRVVPAPQPVVIPVGATTATVIVKPKEAGRAVLTASVPDRNTPPATITATAGRRRAVRR